LIARSLERALAQKLAGRIHRQRSRSVNGRSRRLDYSASLANGSTLWT
jgi:hypothetical protein